MWDNYLNRMNLPSTRMLEQNNHMHSCHLNDANHYEGRQCWERLDLSVTITIGDMKFEYATCFLAYITVETVDDFTNGRGTQWNQLHLDISDSQHKPILSVHQDDMEQTME